MNTLISRKRILLVLLCFAFGFIKAQQTAEKFVQETQYLLYLPDGYLNDTLKKWPLLIFLHGAGESGTELSKVKVHGPPKLIEQGKKFPFIVVSPQAPPNTGWRAETIKAMLDDLKRRYRVDHDRVYLTGLSMGGFGAWDIAQKFPDEFAAIAPICGGGDDSRVWRLRHLPVWCFHGAKDDVVLPVQSQKMIDALKKYNDNIRFTLYPEADHNSWDLAYNNDSLYDWLLAQKKFRHQAITLPPQSLKMYEGVYFHNTDSITIKVENGKLMAKPGKNSIEIKPASATIFFWDDNSVEEVQFTLNKKGAANGFILMTNEMTPFKKLP